MAKLGTLLQETREAKEISLEQVDTDIKIKSRYIESLESGNYDAFPSKPMVRGFIRNYAIYLKLDPAEALNLYEEDTGLQNNKKLKRKQGIVFKNISIEQRRSTFSIDSFITLLIITALIGSTLFLAYAYYLEPAQAQPGYFPEVVEYQQAESNNSAIVLPTPTPLPTDTPTPAPTPTPEYYTGVAVELDIQERSWIQILVDDQKVFEGVLEAGDRPNWTGEKRVAIRAGNGGGVEVYVNGQNMGFMGEPGQVIDQVWEKVDEIPDAQATETPVS